VPVGIVVDMGPTIYSTTGVIARGRNKGVRVCILTPRVLTDAVVRGTAIDDIRARGVDCRLACSECPIASASA
jgi:hypothetical protein